jgi:hypothetical protein
MKNYVLHIQELREFYAEGNENKYVKKAKQDFIDSIATAMANPNWYREIASEKTTQEKQERVQKIRERNKRLRQNKAGTEIESVSNYGDASNYQTTKTMNGGGLSIAFDFSNPVQHSIKNLDKSMEEEKRKKVEENKQKMKNNFLKRRANLKYDPLKAVEDDKVKRQAIISDLASVDIEDGQSIDPDRSPKISATALKLGNLIEKEKVRKMINKKISVKDIMNSPKITIDKPKTNVSEQFQNLDYLKKVPKRIDCWLSKDRKMSSGSSNVSKNETKGRNSQSQNLKHPQTTKAVSSSMNNIEDFSQFSKAVGLDKRVRVEKPSQFQKETAASRDYNVLGRLNDSEISGESFNILNTNKSQLYFKSRHGFESPNIQGSPKNVKASLFSNEGECLEYLLDRLEVNSNQVGLMSSIDKLMLREDKSILDQMKQSKSLLDIFTLMNHVEKVNSTKDEAIKKNYDFEFEKLLIKLKEEYRGLFKKKHQDRDRRMYL